MKKCLLVATYAILGLISCTNEGNVITSAENMKTTEMKNFRNAFKTLGEPQNRATEEEKRSSELSERRKALLVPASKNLILSTGISEKEMMEKTKGNSGSIIVWAYKIYKEKNTKINQSLKSQN